ncbi:MAG TPA: hypothetical protein VFS43_24810 [Polyangiaceae bacterium]|nr:hypothetical protein [Polyangiaceae bacterium]
MPRSPGARSLAAGTALACLLAAGAARADRPRQHDSFYLRLGVGPGFVSDPAKVEFGGLEGEATLTGVGAATEVALGGTVAPGLIVGGGIYSQLVVEPRANDAEISVFGLSGEVDDVTFESFSFHLLGPFVDYYVDPRRGFHLQGSVGLGLLGVGDGEVDGNDNPALREHGSAGVGAMVGIGYDWWVSDRWSLGVLGRVSYAAMSGENDDEAEWSHRVLAPALLFTATMN